MAYRFLQRGLLAILLAGLFAGTAAAQDLSGLWYGERKTRDGLFVQWLSDRRTDGYFAIEFRYFRDCKLEQVEHQVGRWSFAGNILATHVHMLDGARKDIRHRYIVDRLEGDQMLYRHVETGTPFRAARVPAGSGWPDCESAELTS